MVCKAAVSTQRGFKGPIFDSPLLHLHNTSLLNNCDHFPKEKAERVRKLRIAIGVQAAWMKALNSILPFTACFCLMRF